MVQDEALRDQCGDVGFAIETDYSPSAFESEVGLGRPATQDGEICQCGVAQRGLSQALHDRHVRRRAHTVACGQQRVDRQGGALVTAKPIRGQTTGLSIEFGGRCPLAVGGAGLGERVEFVGERGVWHRGGGDTMIEPVHRIGHQIGCAAAHLADTTDSHHLEHCGLYQRSGDPGMRVGRHQSGRSLDEPGAQGVVECAQRIGDICQFDCHAQGLVLVENA